ncbi:A24 family peptidase [Micromonospora sp. KC606]|uniref:prepilin peptidase n=1 Tax=Micromonospora sp. KC606 TaxID=2530379 RepID=UPI001FB81632|nr:A24 family peptidase [Micromonospora sp. KC606]
MSVGLLTAAALLGALAGVLSGRAAPVLARRFPGPAPPTAPDPAAGCARSSRRGPPGCAERPVPTAPDPAAGCARSSRSERSGRVNRPRPPIGPGPTAGRTDQPARRIRAYAVSGAVGAVVFGGLAAARGADPALPGYLLMAGGGLVLARVDLVCLRLPDPLVAAIALTGGAGLVAAASATGTPARLWAALAGVVLSFTGYALLALLPGSRLGYGDVKLAAVLGLPLGWIGWPALGLGVLLPHLLNGVVVLGLLAARRVRRDTALPFGPALLAGAWLAVLLT